jgi:type IV pilus assembly protein PilM
LAFDLPFASKTPPLIGLDIGSSSVKVVELSEAGKGMVRLERYAIEPLPRGAVVDGNVDKIDVVAEAVKRAWRRAGGKIRNVSMALPASAVITKRIALPGNLREEELEMQVESEANQYIPFALDEVSLDFQVLGPIPNAPDDVEVLIAASRKEKIIDRVAVAESAGLKAAVMDVDVLASQTAFELIESQFPDGGKDQNIAMVDVGASVMAVNVLRNDQSIYMREHPFGGNQLTQEIQNKFGLSPEEAEAAKRTGGLPDNYEADVLQPYMDMLGLEVARALQFFFTSTQHNQIHHIVLSGGSAAIPGVDEAVSKRVQVNTIIANPFVNMQVSGKIKAKSLTQDAPSLMVACGLAMRRFDP